MYRTDLIRMAKAKLDLTDEEIADRANLSRPTVNAILNGKSVTLDSLTAVAKVLDLSLPDLFTSPDVQETGVAA